MSVFGPNPYSSGPYSRPGYVMTMTRVLPMGQNQGIAFFDATPRTTDPLGFDSVTNPSNWTLTPVDTSIPSAHVPEMIFVPVGDRVPTFSPKIVKAEPDDDDPTQILFWVDADFEPDVIYRLNLASRVRAVGCVPFDPIVPLEFRGLRRGPEVQRRFVQEDPYRDWDNPVIPPEGQTSTLQIDGTGDFKIAESLRKRIYRRIFSPPGGFMHLGEGYGIQMSIKRIAKPGELQQLANRIAEQVRQEPDVARSGVSISITQRGLVRILVSVSTSDRRDLRFLFEVPQA